MDLNCSTSHWLGSKYKHINIPNRQRFAKNVERCPFKTEFTLIFQGFY